MKYCFIIICSIIFFSACTQSGIEDSSKRNENWVWFIDSKSGEGKWIPLTNLTTVEDGSFTMFYFNGEIYSKGKVRDFKNVDTIFNYGLNRKLKLYVVLGKDSSRSYYYYENGPFLNYNANGKLIAVGIVQDHKQGDKWKIYYDNGNLHEVNDFVNDTGIVKVYYENGQIKDSALHMGQSTNLLYKEWYPNGQVSQVRGWKAGIQQGISLSYYQNGQMKDSSFAINGKPEGLVKAWFENGKINVVGSYKNGILDGEWTYYFENGQIDNQRLYKNGEFNGRQIDYYENGQLKKTAKFRNGIQIGTGIEYSENGSLINN